MNASQWSKHVSNSEAYRRAGGRRRINRERRAAAFWLSWKVFSLGHQGMLPLEIAKELDIHPSTAYRHYWRWFGKLRPKYARAKRFYERLLEQQEARRLKEEREERRRQKWANRKSDPVKFKAFSERLRALRDNESAPETMPSGGSESV